MGLRVVTTFDTPEGFPVTVVYVRIAKLLLSNFRDGAVTVTAILDSHITREKRLANASILQVPAMPGSFDVETTLAAATQFDALYAGVKQGLIERGFTVEDVFEVSQQSSESTP